MTHIIVKLKDGKVHEFKDSRNGGSYTNQVRAETGFLVVTNVWGKETWFPTADVEVVENLPARGGW